MIKRVSRLVVSGAPRRGIARVASVLSNAADHSAISTPASISARNIVVANRGLSTAIRANKEFNFESSIVQTGAQRLFTTSTNSGMIRFATPKCTNYKLNNYKLNIPSTRLYASTSDISGLVKVQMPALSPTMTQGNIVAWRKKVGEKVNAGDVLGEIATDKATLDFESPEEGYVAKILVEAGTNDVPVGAPVIIIVENKDDIPKVADLSFNTPAKTSEGVTKVHQEEPQQQKPQAQTQHTQPAKIYKGHLSPAVRHLVESHGIDPNTISPSGKAGRILKGDVLRAISGQPAPAPKAQALQQQPQQPQQPQQQAAQPKPAAPKQAPPAGLPTDFTDIPTSQIRKVIAQRLTQSKQTIPHTYVEIECRIDTAMKLRNFAKEAGINFSLNDMIIGAASQALRDVPECNVVFNPQTGEHAISKSIDISVAVATDKGLITPIVKNADSKRLSEIATTVKDLATRAREGKLKPEEFQGGSFSISNLGMFGIDYFSAVINPPQGIIMAVGGSSKKVVVKGSKRTFALDADEELPAAGPVDEDALETATYMSVTLSCDARAVDEMVAAKFLQRFKKYMEDPQSRIL